MSSVPSRMPESRTVWARLRGWRYWIGPGVEHAVLGPELREAGATLLEAVDELHQDLVLGPGALVDERQRGRRAAPDRRGGRSMISAGS